MKKDKNQTNEYQEIKDEIISDKVSEIFRKHPDKYIQKLEEVGFEYYDEEDYEKIEEDKATPQNQHQEFLVSYFEGENELSEITLQAYLEERDSEHPNYPLIRRYFKEKNQNLKALILFGLDCYPARIDLLSDLAYFHEFENILSILISHYTNACVNEMNIETFSELAQDFYYAANPDGYEALYALQELFEEGTEKRKIVDLLISDEEKEREGKD